MVTLGDHSGRLAGEVKHRRWGHGGPGLPGLSPNPGGCPRGHHVHSRRRRRAGIHRAGTALLGWVRGRLHRPDPRGVRAGPAPVRRLVPAAPHPPVPGPPHRHRVPRPRPGSPRPRPGHHHPPAVHHRRVLQGRGGGRTTRPFTGRSCPPPPGGTTSRTPPGWTETSSARCWPPLGSARRRARAHLSAGPQRATRLRGHRRHHRGPGASSAGTAPW
jgi:hypothetical protein